MKKDNQNTLVPSFGEQLQRYSVALISLAVALISLGYNTWRNELTEDNRNIRSAGIEMTLAISDLHEVVFFGHYSPNELAGDPRKGWAYILTLRDLSMVMPEDVQVSSEKLLATWQVESGKLAKNDASNKQINLAIDDLRMEILKALESLH